MTTRPPSIEEIQDALAEQIELRSDYWPSHPDGWYDPDKPAPTGLSFVQKLQARIAALEGEVTRLTATLVEATHPWMSTEMQTTATERADWAKALSQELPGIRESPERQRLRQLLNDVALYSAEITRLTALNADLCAVNLRHAETLSARPTP